jgi:hypothetical protein
MTDDEFAAGVRAIYDEQAKSTLREQIRAEHDKLWLLQRELEHKERQIKYKREEIAELLTQLSNVGTEHPLYKA